LGLKNTSQGGCFFLRPPIPSYFEFRSYLWSYSQTGTSRTQVQEGVVLKQRLIHPRHCPSSWLWVVGVRTLFFPLFLAKSWVSWCSLEHLAWLGFLTVLPLGDTQDKAVCRHFLAHWLLFQHDVVCPSPDAAPSSADRPTGQRPTQRLSLE
jgi:hypothetical protein